MKSIIDSVAAYELVLYTDNTYSMYAGYVKPTIATLAQHMKRGEYSEEKACKAWEHVATWAAKHYCREYASANEKYYNLFNAATRKEAARQMEENYREDVEEKANEKRA